MSFKIDLRTHEPIRTHGVMAEHWGAETIRTNLPVVVVHHSPTGWGWGYQGSGAADFALNIMEVALVHILGYNGPRVECYYLTCSDLAWDLHQEFKRDVVAQYESEKPFHLPFHKIVGWLSQQDDDRVDGLLTGESNKEED